MRESGFHDISKGNLRGNLTENGKPIRNIGLKSAGWEYLSFRGVYIDSSIVALPGSRDFSKKFFGNSWDFESGFTTRNLKLPHVIP